MSDALTIAEAMRLTGASERTLRRRLAEQRFPGAFREGPEPTAAWRIPLADLEADGFRIAATVAQAGEPVSPELVTQQLAHLQAARESDRAEIQKVSQALEISQARTAMLEQLLERERTHTGELQAAQDLLASERAERLEELQAERDHLRTQVETLQAALAAPRRRWWQR